MNPIDPLRPSSHDDIVRPVESGPAYGGYGAASSYTPYRREMPWVPTPPPEMPRYYEPRPEPPLLPRYEDGLLTFELFGRAMRDLNG